MFKNIALKGALGQDALASIVVFLVALPLCMGIAIASGVPPAAGLITGIIGGLIVGSISGCPLQVSGPAAGLAVIIYELIQKFGIEMLGPVIILAGIFQVGAGLLRGGQLFRAIAPSVIYGMLAGIGVLILSAQFHVMVDDKPRASGIQNLLSIPESIYKGILPVDGSSHHIAAFLGICTIAILLGWAKFSKLKFIPGALVAVVFATAIAQIFSLPVRYVDLPSNLLSAIRLPGMSELTRLGDPTFIIAAVALAFVASAETLLSAAAVDQLHDGPRTNYDRELLSQGVGNVLCGIAGGLPMTGVIVRSATNVAAGARTRMSAIFHGAWLLLLVAAAPQILRLVPVASLAAVLVYTGFKLVNPQNVRRLLGYGRMPVLIYATTVIVIVAKDLLTGIIAGLVLSLVNVVYALSQMHIRVDAKSDRWNSRTEVHLTGAATFIRLPQLLNALDSVPQSGEVHVHIRRLQYIDHACVDAIGNWERQRNQKSMKTIVEWDELMSMYRNRNQLRPQITQPGTVAS